MMNVMSCRVMMSRNVNHVMSHMARNVTYITVRLASYGRGKIKGMNGTEHAGAGRGNLGLEKARSSCESLRGLWERRTNCRHSRGRCIIVSGL